jgi:AraC-like DNA-binding protein
LDYYSHVDLLDGITYWKAPPGAALGGHVIGKGMEKIEIITEGYGRYEFPPHEENNGIVSRSVRVGPGAIVWHTAGGVTLKDSDAIDPYRCMVFNFKLKSRRRFDIPHLSIWHDVAECNAFCWETFAHYHRHTYDPDILGFHIYARFLWEVRKGIAHQTLASMPVAVQRMAKAIQQSPEASWSISSLGKIAGISESHVHLLFRKHLKISPHYFLLTHRLNKSKELLIASSMRVKEICHACGFTDSAHFSRLFRMRVGYTPLAYRGKYAAP